MRLKQILVFTFSLFLIVTSIKSQSNVTVHLDKPYYVTGEVVWYKLYMPSAFQEASGKIKVVVQANDNSVIEESFVQLTAGSMSGYYKIPFDIASGLYHFSFFALEQKELAPTKLTKFEVPIYNDIDGTGIVPVFPNATQRAKVEGAMAGGLKLNVEIDESEKMLRDDVVVSAKVVGADGQLVPSNISVSVVDRTLVGSSVKGNCVFTKPLALGYGVNIALDERIFIQGNISDATTNTPAKVSVMGAFKPQENKMYYTKSNEDGRFTLLMKDQVGPSSLQIAGYLYDEYFDTKIQLDQPVGINPNIAMTSDYDTEILSYLEESAVRKRIYQHFNLLESDASFVDYSKELEMVKPNKTLKVSEYVSFPTIGKFFDEILGTQLNFYSEDGITKARMFNPESNKNAKRNAEYYFPRSPVFLIDGKMTKNGAYVANMKLDQVENIYLYYDWRDITKQYGTFGDFGYVVIETTMADIDLPEEDKEDIISYTGLQPSVNYPVAITSKDRSMPMLKPLVYWHPNLTVANEKDSQVSFVASDDAGIFDILVVAQTEDGQVLTATTSYTAGGAN